MCSAMDRLVCSLNAGLSDLGSPDGLFTYNPLVYARAVFDEYEGLCFSGSGEVLFLGMNPGPFGMMQLGVPFGARSLARDYLGLSAPVLRPAVEHPKRPILGWDISRDEVSGKRFWSAIRARHPRASDFFAYACVQNFCPLAFLDSEGRNVTPEALDRSYRKRLEDICLDHLDQLIHLLGARRFVAVGGYAGKMLARLGHADMKIPHPSPLNRSAAVQWADDGALVRACLIREGGLR